MIIIISPLAIIFRGQIFPHGYFSEYVKAGNVLYKTSKRVAKGRCARSTLSISVYGNFGERRRGRGVDVRGLKESSARNLFSLQFSPSYFHFVNASTCIFNQKANPSTRTSPPVRSENSFNRCVCLNNVCASGSITHSTRRKSRTTLSYFTGK